jgi:hypothetical protein
VHAAGNLQKMKEYFGKQEKAVKKVKLANVTRKDK